MKYSLVNCKIKYTCTFLGGYFKYSMYSLGMFKNFKCVMFIIYVGILIPFQPLEGADEQDRTEV